MLPFAGATVDDTDTDCIGKAASADCVAEATVRVSLADATTDASNTDTDNTTAQSADPGSAPTESISVGIIRCLSKQTFEKLCTHIVGKGGNGGGAGSAEARASQSQILTSLPLFSKRLASKNLDLRCAMISDPRTLGAGAKTCLESRTKKFTPHCICRPSKRRQCCSTCLTVVQLMALH